MLDEPGQAISVSFLTDHIKAVVEGTFPPVWVNGEISGLSQPRSGHKYFTLKDDTAQIRCVIWRSTAERLKLDLKDGQEIDCFGGLEVYAARGTYQLVVRKARSQGIGALQQAFLELQSKLQAEGLFAAERKRPLPAFPKRIGIVTSASGAAVRDFLQAAAERWAGAQIFVIPSQVQGPGSVQTLVSGLRLANRVRPALDVVILSRGGGSLEDLWSFNEEKLVRAVAKSKVPTVSAVGHEVDITLCDLAADVRALTPTDAATKVIPDGNFFDESIRGLTSRLHRSMRAIISQRSEQLSYLSQRPVIRKPTEMIHVKSHYLEELENQATRAIRESIERMKSRVATGAASLSALSPLSVLTRGYSMTFDADGKTIESPDHIRVGDEITTKLHLGEIKSRVIKPD